MSRRIRLLSDEVAHLKAEHDDATVIHDRAEEDWRIRDRREGGDRRSGKDRRLITDRRVRKS